MTELKGFTAVFEEEAEPEKTSMIRGSMKRLREIHAAKRRAKEQRASEAKQEPIVIDEGTGKPEIPVKDIGILKGTGSPKGTGKSNGTVPQSLPNEMQDGEVKVFDNYMRFDMDIFDILPTLTDAENRMYLDLIRRSYGQSPAQNTCTTTFRAIGRATGVTSPNTRVTILRALEEKGLVKRIYTSRSMKEKSVFRVYLPCERPGSESTTRIRYGSRKRSTQNTD